MAHSGHENTNQNVDLAYERNEIQLKGILFFAGGLFLLVVITFGLMWALYGVMESDAKVRMASDNPMQLSEIDRLPPEPRLQGAPGFGVESEKGRINLELGAPQAEYLELQKQWKELREKGLKHPETGVVIAMPIEDAKKALLEQNIKAKSGEDAERTMSESRKLVSDSSSGRRAGFTRN